jgi:drug/metabolite transporter (DMT)-like permease
MIFTWVSIALVGYFFLAITGVADKFLVSKVVKQPIAYAFYTAVTGPFSLALLLLGGKLLSPGNMAIALAAGACFIVGIYFSYSAIGKMSVSRTVPIQGGLVPFFSLIFAYFILGERLTNLQISAIGFLIIGAVLISLRKDHGHWSTQAFMDAALSSIFFALTSVLTKYTFVHANDSSNINIPELLIFLPFRFSPNFITGLVWPSVGFVIPILPMLFFKNNREAIFNAPKEAGIRNVALYYTSRASGTVGGYLQKYAVFLGSVSVVNALQGMQFVFLLIFTTVFSVYYPKVLKERINKETVAIKLTAIVFISCGLFLLTR